MPTAHPNEHQTSTVCLDGSEVKRQRELHGLTQLYVSKVVGVTTDTISRWENNRYPTIRRENAINLAEALEVPLEQILRQETDEVAEPVRPVSRVRRFLIFAAGVGACLILIAVWFYLDRQPETLMQVDASRQLPAFAAPATTIPVQIEFERQADAGGFILREDFPEGWKLTEAAPPPTSLDNVHGIARWIIKSGNKTGRIAYMVQVADSAARGREASFHGEVIAGSGNDRASAAVAGDVGVKVAPIHWADADGDGRIDDVEMLDTSYFVDEMVGVHIDWDRLERFWAAGGYRWDAQKQEFLPVQVEEPGSP